MEPKVKKGLIIGGSVAAAVLLAGSITVGVLLTRTPSGLVEGPVHTAAFSDGVSSSAVRQDTWMGIDKDAATGTFDATLTQNEYYHSVTDDEKMIDDVQSNNGVGYISQNTVAQYSDLKTLAVSEDKGAHWITAESGTYPTSAPLDMVFKVPQPVGVVMKGHLPTSTPTALSFNDLNVAGSNYGDWVKNKYAFNYAMSFIVFAWAAESKDAHDALAAGNFGFYNSESVSKDAFDAWIQGTFKDEAWGICNKDGNIDFHGITNDSFEVNIDGTGTDELSVNIILESLSDTYEIQLIQNLNNHGSGAAWYMDSTNEKPDWANGDGTNDMTGFGYANPGTYNGATNSGFWGAFLGTQSRATEEGDAAFGGKDDAEKASTGWGYDWTTYVNSGVTDGDATDVENTMYNYDNIIKSEDTPLMTTMATDQIVFYTTTDAYFEMDGKDYVPTGITREGAKDLFQNGKSYQELVKLKELRYVAK